MYNEKKTNYGKIIAITVAAVTGACAIIWFALKALFFLPVCYPLRY